MWQFLSCECGITQHLSGKLFDAQVSGQFYFHGVTGRDGDRAPGSGICPGIGLLVRWARLCEHTMIADGQRSKPLLSKTGEGYDCWC